MKKSFFVIYILAAISVFAQSPISTGTYTVGGGFSFASISEDNSDNSTTVISLSPNIGYFFIDNLFAGLGLNYTSTSFGDDVSRSSFGIGPKFRYFFDANDKLKPFLGAGYTYNSITYSDDDESSQSTINIEGGVDLFITNFFALEGSLNYGIINQEYTSSDYSSDNESTMFSIQIGVNYFIQ